jgi:hypothetical protein
MAKPLTFIESSNLQKAITVEQQKMINKVYSQAYNNVRKEIKKLDGKENVSSILKREELKKLRTKINREYIKSNNLVKEAIEKNMDTVSKAVVEDNVKFVKQLGLPVNGVFSHVPSDIVKNVTLGKVYDVDWTLSKAIWGDNKKKLNDINSVIAKGIAENKSSYDIAKDLEKYVNPNAKKDWEWSKVYPGTNKKIDYNAQRLARTMVHHAYQQSVIETSKPNPFIEGIKWLSAYSHRTCQLCISRAEDDSYGLGPGVYPPEAVPLDHPNGLCTLDSEIVEDMEDIADRLGDWALGKEDSAIDEYANSLYGTNKFGKIKDTVKKNNPKAKKVIKSFEEDLEETTNRIEKGLSVQKGEEFRAKMDNSTKAFAKKITNQEKDAIYDYTGSNYRRINGMLRNPEKYADDTSIFAKRAKESSDLVTSALNKNPLKETLYVRRGTDLDGLQGILGPEEFAKAQSMGSKEWLLSIKDTMPGRIAQDKGFLSTSPFERGGFGGTVEFKLELPKGTKAAYVDRLSSHQGEMEMLIQRDTRFIISKVDSKIYVDEEQNYEKVKKVIVWMKAIVE